ncbi:MAG: hypothetical protein ACK40X_01380 [Armatimonadota bacterium]
MKVIVMVEGVVDEILVRMLVDRMKLSGRCEFFRYAEAKEGFIGVVKTQLNNPLVESEPAFEALCRRLRNAILETKAIVKNATSLTENPTALLT